MNKNKLLVILCLLLLVSFIRQYSANANDCPRYKFAKKYKEILTGVISGQLTNKKPGVFKIKRLGYNQYLIVRSDGSTSTLEENCGKITSEYFTVSPFTSENGDVLYAAIQYSCQGFLKVSKVAINTCNFSYVDPFINEKFEDTLFTKWQPIK